MNHSRSLNPDELRRRAEALVDIEPLPTDLKGQPSHLHRMIHELQVHEIELEMQNEELRRAHAEEDRLRERYSDFYDFSPTGFISLDRNGGIIQANLTGARLLGQERARLVGERFSTFLEWLDRPVFETFLKQVFEDGANHACELNVTAPGPVPRNVHVEATLSPDRQECRAVLVDLTQQHQASEERRFLEHELQQSQKLDSLGSLAGGMAHDMNNVLGAILGLASTMQVTAEPFSVNAKCLDTIMSACMRGRDVVKSLLCFAHKGTGEAEPTNLNQLVTEIIQLLGSTTLKRIKLEMELQDNLPLITADAGALSNALMNLCINAIDAMPNGGTLRLETHLLEDGSLELWVEDSGVGMSERTLAKAVDPFFTTKPIGKGTGLGLSMVYGAMKAHEGSLELHSQVGKGTKATLHFPASRTTLAGPSVPTEHLPPTTATQALDVLLVDDDELIRVSMAGMLETLGYRVIVASGGQEALQLLASGLHVDLVMLDMNMPGMSGSQALPKILALRPGLPLLIDTGYGDEEMLPLLADRPSVRSIMKPFTLQELRAKLDALVLLKPPVDA